MLTQVPRSKTIKKKRKAGFTLLELMVVLGIVAVMATIAVPNFTNMYNEMNAQSFAEEMYSYCNIAHSMAQRKGMPHIFVVDSATREIMVIADNNLDGVPDTASETAVRRKPFPNGIVVGPADGFQQSPLPAPYNFITPNTACSFCGGNLSGHLVFNPSGQVLDNAGKSVSSAYISIMPLRDQAKNEDGRIKLVTLIGQTGDVRIWRK